MYLADSHPHVALLEPVSFYSLIFNDEMYSIIACEMERYASLRNDAIHVIQQEIKAFIGILLTRYCSRPHQRL